MKNISSSLFSNIVIHHRFLPFEHKFKYNLTSCYIDYDELNLLDKKISFFSINKFNFFSFYEKDHGYRDNRNLKEFVIDILSKNSIKYSKLKFKILCFPRILGYVFNPISIFFCFDNENLIAILYEVKNTSNEQHTYCFVGPNFKAEKTYKHKCKKIFYVSPFIKMNCIYKFFTSIPSKELSIFIEQYNNKGKKIFFASQKGKKINLSSATILISFIKHPMMTLKVILGIHYEALKIFLKGGKYYSRDKKPNDTISFEGKL
tara:strand:+ start:6766 stop:7548 length:783 start_codon:yes stop_codon:yes gene_type:complete